MPYVGSLGATEVFAVVVFNLIKTVDGLENHLSDSVADRQALLSTYSRSLLRPRKMVRKSQAEDTYHHTLFESARSRQVRGGEGLATYLRCAFLHGTQAEATCPFVFLCDFGEAKDCWLSCVGGREVTVLYPGTGPEVGIGAGAGRYGCCWESIWPCAGAYAEYGLCMWSSGRGNAYGIRSRGSIW